MARKITDPNDRRFWTMANVYDEDEAQDATFADWAPLPGDAAVRLDGSKIVRPAGDTSTLNIGEGIDNG